MSTYHLYKWSVRSMFDNPYMAPELNPKCLVGFRDQESRRIRSSAIKSIDGRTITTQSGSVYILEDIDPMYLEYMNSSGVVYDQDNPIKIRKS